MSTGVKRITEATSSPAAKPTAARSSLPPGAVVGSTGRDSVAVGAAFWVATAVAIGTAVGGANGVGVADGVAVGTAVVGTAVVPGAAVLGAAVVGAAVADGAGPSNILAATNSPQAIHFPS